MKVIRPVTMTDAALVSSSVAETDHAAWSGGTTYALGDRVIKTATHRVYESLLAGNIGHDPTADANTQWLDVGPTNRWTMFDEAIGPGTTATSSLVVVLAPGTIDAIGLVDVIGATARVQIAISGYPAYDETLPVGKAVLTFFDLPSHPSAQITVTIAGTGTVSVGELVIGNNLDLGQTEASPTVSIVDFSKRTTDDFGNTTIEERSWAKTVTLRSQIPTDDVDDIQVAVAKLRAKPALWVGEDGYDSLTVYGFFKSFSIDLAMLSFSYCSFNLEGLSQ